MNKVPRHLTRFERTVSLLSCHFSKSTLSMTTVVLLSSSLIDEEWLRIRASKLITLRRTM